MRWIGAQPVHGCSDDRRVLDPQRELIGLVDAVTASDLVQPIGDALSSRLETCSKPEQPCECRYPVLVRYGCWVDAIANGLFIAVHQARYPTNPLEPGQGVDERLVV